MALKIRTTEVILCGEDCLCIELAVPLAVIVTSIENEKLTIFIPLAFD